MDRSWKRFNQHGVSRSALFAWVVCGLGALFYCYEYLLRISPSVMSTDLMRAYHLDAAGFGNLAAFYYYAYTPMQLPVGVLMDHYGPRRLLILACGVCAIGTYLFANEHSLFIAHLGRFLVGFGSAFAFIGVLKLAIIWLPPTRFALIAGLTTTLGMVGAMVGDIVMATLVKSHGWKSTIFSSAAVGILLAIVFALMMPNGMVSHQKSKESTFQSIKLLFIGLLKLLKDRYIWLNGLVGCLMYLPLSAFGELWGVPYLEDAFHYSRTEAAGIVSFIFLGWAVGGPLAGWVSDRIEYRKQPIIVGCTLTMIIFSLLIYVPGLGKITLILLSLLLGIASSAQVIIFAVAREISPRNLSATALAFTNMIVMLGGVVLQPLVGILLDWCWSRRAIKNVGVYLLSDYRVALAALPISAAIGVLIMLFMKETHGSLVDEI